MIRRFCGGFPGTKPPFGTIVPVFSMVFMDGKSRRSKPIEAKGLEPSESRNVPEKEQDSADFRRAFSSQKTGEAKTTYVKMYAFGVRIYYLKQGIFFAK